MKNMNYPVVVKAPRLKTFLKTIHAQYVMWSTTILSVEARLSTVIVRGIVMIVEFVVRIVNGTANAATNVPMVLR